MSVLIAAFPESKEIGMKIARQLKAQYTNIHIGNFPDSEFHMELKKDPRNKTVVIVSSMAGNPDDKLIEAILAGGICRDYKAKKVILVATYFPYLRQDTHFMKFDSFSSKYITRMFSNFDKVLTIDPHLHRIKNMHLLSNKFEHITVNSAVAQYIKKRFKSDFKILGPDGESEQWNKPVAKMLGKEVVVLTKQRFSSTHIRSTESKEDKAKKLDGNVIIIDDIISTGKTIAGALALARKQGAKKLFCIGIHGLLVNNAVALITKHAELITTNTVPSKFSKIDVSPLIADYLKKHLKS